MPKNNGSSIISRLKLEAALDEMGFWNRIMADHAKFIRGGVDPTEEQVFRVAEAYAKRYDQLVARVGLTNAGNIAAVNVLDDESMVVTSVFRDFKARLTRLIQACRVVTELPAALLDHIRREADFFLTMLLVLEGRPLPSRDVLGIPDGGAPVNLLPRRLIPLAGENIILVARDENLFWLRIHKEHGEVLLLIAYRPEVQESLYNATAEFEADLDRLLEEADTVPLNANAMKMFGQRIYPAVARWRDFLREMHRQVLECEVPTGQINAPALILDHMAREAEYHLEVLAILDSSLN